METRAKKKTFNIIMVVLIIIIVGCGIMAVGFLKGWFGGNSESEIVTLEITGVANIERDNVGYTLEKDVPVKSGDTIETKNGSQADFQLSGKGNLTINEKTEIKADSCQDGEVTITLEKGELIASAEKGPDSFEICLVNNTPATITGTNSVLSVSSQKSSSEIDVFQGTVSVTSDNGETQKIEAGNRLQMSAGKDSEISMDASRMDAVSLNDFQIGKLIEWEDETCFSSDELEKVVADREKEKNQAAKALEKEAIAISEGETAESGDGSQAGSSEKVMTCTISINCGSILKNMDKLTAGKNKYVPSNGVILSTSSVQFNKGDTVFDVLKRACAATGIQLEYTYSATYSGNYIEGINHLYEFDCGETSGWTYKVNGWYPNYGCSSYKLKDGDSIVWNYTCSGN